MFTEAELNQIENVIYNVLKNENILQKKTGQTVLDIQTDVSIEECDAEYMKNKSLACWYFSNSDGKSQGIQHDQLFIFGNGQFIGRNTKVLKALPFTLNEAMIVWESYLEEGNSLTDVFIITADFKYSPSKADVQFIIWALKNHKCDWMLRDVESDRYNFNFKKFIGKSK